MFLGLSLFLAFRRQRALRSAARLVVLGSRVAVCLYRIEPLGFRVSVWLSCVGRLGVTIVDLASSDAKNSAKHLAANPLHCRSPLANHSRLGKPTLDFVHSDQLPVGMDSR